MNKKLSKIINKVIIASLSLSLFIGQVTVVKAETLPNTTPPTQQELKKYKNMTLEDLKAVAKPMPESAIRVDNDQFGTSYNLKDDSYIPEDGGIYYIQNSLGSDKYIEFYKFLYVTPATKPLITYHVYVWGSVNNTLEQNGIGSGDLGNEYLYNQLKGGAASGGSTNTNNNSNNDSSSSPSSTNEQSTSNSNGSNSGPTNNSSSSSNIINSKNKKRISGTNRYETAKLIAEEFNSSTVQNIILATGENFPDALSGSVLAKKLGAPILLVNANDNKFTLEYISKHLDKNGTIYILGGNGAVDESIVSNLGYKVIRLNGNTRYDTNIKINEVLNVQQGTPLIIATANDFPDALSISSIAAIKGYPIVLAGKDTLSEQEKAYISSIKPIKIFIVGGTGVISDSVKDEIKTMIGIGYSNIIRISGSNRYETSLSIAKYFNLTGNNIIMATGENFPDAITGSAFATKNNSPILLINKDTTEQKAFINGSSINNIYILGGTAVISQDTEDALMK